MGMLILISLFVLIASNELYQTEQHSHCFVIPGSYLSLVNHNIHTTLHWFELTTQHSRQISHGAMFCLLDLYILGGLWDAQRILGLGIKLTSSHGYTLCIPKFLCIFASTIFKLF